MQLSFVYALEPDPERMRLSLHCFSFRDVHVVYGSDTVDQIFLILQFASVNAHESW